MILKKNIKIKKIGQKNRIYMKLVLIIVLGWCGMAIASPEYPQRWTDRAPVPLIMTMDHVKLPGTWGFGSGSLHNWIKTNIKADKSLGIVNEETNGK